MLKKYINFLLFFIFTTSFIIIINGLNFEGVGSGDGSQKGKGSKNKGKMTCPNERDSSCILKKFFKTDIKEREKGSASKSTIKSSINDTLGTEKEHDIGDALDNICKDLTMNDLISARSVCRSWHEAASREISNRGIERALLPHTDTVELLDENSNFHVYDILRSMPHVALLFVGPSNRERNCDDLDTTLETHISNSYKKFFPQHLVTIGVDVSMMDKTVITSCSGDLGPPNGILGLFIPFYKDLQIKVATGTCASTYDISNCAERIINNLIPENDSRRETTIIMFGSSYLGIYVAEEVLKLIKNRFEQKSYTLWGGIFDDELKAIDSRTTNRYRRQDTTLFAVSLTSSNLKSWSTIIDCRIKKKEFDQHLLKFKNSIILKQKTIGLACGPRYVEDLRSISPNNMYLNNNELMGAVKKVFPEIPFIGVFNFGYHSHFGVDSMSDDVDQKLALPMAMSLMILSYDE